MCGLPLTFAVPLDPRRRSRRCRRSGCSCASRRRSRGASTSRRPKILADLRPSRRCPARTPWWLLRCGCCLRRSHRRGRRPDLEPAARKQRPRGPLLIVRRQRLRRRPRLARSHETLPPSASRQRPRRRTHGRARGDVADDARRPASLRPRRRAGAPALPQGLCRICRTVRRHLDSVRRFLATRRLERQHRLDQRRARAAR